MAFVNAFGLIGRFLLASAVLAGGVGVLATGGARIVWLVVALSSGIVGVVLVAIGARLGEVSHLSPSLRAAGGDAMATVTGVRSTGVRINGEPVLELALDVDAQVHGSYETEIRQRVPAFALGGVAPGVRLAVVVDPQDPHRLAVDWDTELEGLEPEPIDRPMPTVRGPRDAADLLRRGRRARAIVISMEDAGDMSELGLVEVGRPGDDDRLFVIDMEVQQPGLDSYEVRVSHPVPERLVGRVGPRTRLDVAVDRDDDQAVAIDWDSVHR